MGLQKCVKKMARMGMKIEGNGKTKHHSEKINYLYFKGLKVSTLIGINCINGGWNCCLAFY